MKDEIKEILVLQNYVNRYKSDEKAIINHSRLTTPLMLDYLEVKNLLDYITNLQQENERLKKDIEVLNDRFYKMRKNKDEQFNSLYVKYTALLEYISLGYKLETPKIILENANGFNKMIVKEREDYKSRCEKAVELIKEAGCYNENTKNFNDDIWDELDDLSNILQNGGDKVENI